MRLDKALDILYGELLHTTYISAFHNITYNLKEVTDGTLFFLLDSNDAQEAIKRGAYGIVLDADIAQLDNEIAWIKVQDIQKSMSRLARYLLLELNFSLVMLTPIEIALAKSLQIGLPILQSTTLQDCLHELFKLYKSAQKEQDSTAIPFVHILLTSNAALASLNVYTCFSTQYARMQIPQKSAHTTQKEAPKAYYKTCSVMSYSLFESKIIWNGMLHKIALPYIFLPFIESLMAVFTFLREEYWNRFIEEAGGLYARKSKTIIRGKEKPFNPRLPKYMHGQISLHNMSFDTLSFHPLDSYLHTSTKNKHLLFCQNSALLSCESLQERDLGYTSGIQKSAHKIFESLRKNRDSNIFIEYLRVHASHLHILSCYARGMKLPKATQKNIILPYAHIPHLTQILTKMPFHLAIIYGISKKEFDKATTLSKHTRKHTIDAPKERGSLFSAYRNEK